MAVMASLAAVTKVISKVSLQLMLILAGIFCLILHDLEGLIPLQILRTDNLPCFSLSAMVVVC